MRGVWTGRASLRFTWHENVDGVGMVVIGDYPGHGRFGDEKRGLIAYDQENEGYRAHNERGRRPAPLCVFHV